jgi:hypothetical protein
VLERALLPCERAWVLCEGVLGQQVLGGALQPRHSSPPCYVFFFWWRLRAVSSPLRPPPSPIPTREALAVGLSPRLGRRLIIAAGRSA